MLHVFCHGHHPLLKKEYLFDSKRFSLLLIEYYRYKLKIVKIGVQAKGIMIAVKEVVLCFIYFAATLIFWQFLFLWLIPQGAVFWKRVDYYWLVVAFIGIITAVQAYSVEKQKQATDDAFKLFKQSYHQIASTLEAGKKQYCKPLKREVCAWYSSQESLQRLPDLTGDFSRALSNEFVDGMKKVPKRTDPIVIAKLFQAIKEYNQALANLQAAEKFEKERLIWKEFASYAPYFIIGLLTLRITKVTADSLMEERGKKYFRDEQPHWFKRIDFWPTGYRAATTCEIFSILTLTALILILLIWSAS